MLASDLPYGEVATSAALAAIRSGIDIVIVNTASGHIGEIALVANPKSNIHKVADLEGKKAGFTNPKSTSELLLRLALKEAGMTGKVDLVGTGGFGGGLTVLDTGGIDAAPLIDPILSLEPDKYRVIFHFADLIPRMTWLVGITTRKFATENPEMVRKLIGVHRRGVDYIYANRDDAMRIYAKVWQQEPENVATYFPKYFGYKGEWSQGRIRQGRAGQDVRRPAADRRSQRPGRLEIGDRPAVPAEGTAEAALTARASAGALADSEGSCRPHGPDRRGVRRARTAVPHRRHRPGHHDSAERDGGALWRILASGQFNDDIGFTLYNTVGAMALAIVVGFFAGALLHALPRLRRLIEPLLSAYYAIPTFVFYPLLIVTFGIGRTALIVMGAMFGVVAMIVNTMLGLDRVPPVIAKPAR